MNTLMDTMETAGVDSACVDAVLTLTLNRPRRKNALTGAMYDTLRAALAAAADDDSVRAVLLRGNGDSFCAGNDIDGFAAVRALPLAQRPGLRFMRALATFPKPLVAAVHGDAVGIGATLLLHCDLVYAAADARFRLPFVDVGLVPEFASTLLLPRSAGPARAAALLLLAEPFSAARAEATGLVSEVVAPVQLHARAQQAARALAAKPAAALRATRQLLRQPLQEALLRTIDAEMAVLDRQLQAPETQRILAGLRREKPNRTRQPDE